MSKNVAMFVDVANMYYAARGQDVDVDYVALLKHASKGRDLIRAYAYTGLDPENENQRKFIDFLAKNGYKPVVKDIRKFGDGRMKANLDIELVVDLFRLADRMDIAVIVSGDGDFAPAIKALQDKGVRAEVISFKPNTSSDLVAVADEFTDIMKIASISRKEGRDVRAGMSAPEMPAKEVSPEFGFREASPSVAAAALAALKGGSADAPRRGGRSAGGSRKTTAAAASPAAEPEGERVAVAASETNGDTDGEGRRRRRRRGGRGRGRTRRDDGAPIEDLEGVGAPGEEIGWEEFDDLTQVDGGVPEDREYRFEEADAATLAELGLSADDVAPAPAEESEAATPRRRASRTKAEPAADGEEKPKARRRTTTRAKADSGDADAAAPAAPKRRRTAAKETNGGGEAPAPRRRTSRSAAAKAGDDVTSDAASAPAGDDSMGDSGEEPQGIWGRFRAARRPRGSAG